MGDSTTRSMRRMITRREMIKTMAGSAAVATQLFAAMALAEAAEGGAEGGAKDAGKAANPTASDKGVTVRPVLQHDLPDAPGKQVSMLIVEFEAGAGSSPHRHPGSTA